MGEISEMMCDGTLCQCCGEYIESKMPAQGIPRFCWDCMPEEDKARIKKSNQNKKSSKQNNKGK